MDVALSPPPRHPTRPHAAGRRWLRVVVLVAGLGAAAWFVHEELPSWPSLLAALGRVDVGLLLAAAAVEAFSLWLFARQQQALFAGFGVRVPTSAAVAITYSRSAVSMTFPAGSVVSAVFAIEQFRRFGAERSTAATVTVLSGIASAAGLCFLYGVGAAATWLFPGPTQVVTAVVAALGAGYLGAWWANRRALPDRPERIVAASATPWGRLAGLVRARLAEAVTLPGRFWVAGIGYAAANWAADVACLVLVGAAFDLDVPVVEVGLLYLGIQLVRQVPISPGGIGIIETGLVAGLVLLGADSASAAAVTLGYRLLSCWLVVPIGLTSWFLLTRQTRRD